MFVTKRPESGDSKGYVPNTKGFIAALFTAAQSGTTQVSTTRGIDKVDMVCTWGGDIPQLLKASTTLIHATTQVNLVYFKYNKYCMI